MPDYIPPYARPDEGYWEAMLDEGPLSIGEQPPIWESGAATVLPAPVWDEAQALHCSRKMIELVIDSFNRGGLIAYWRGIECFIPASHLLAYPFPADPEAREREFEEYVGQTLCLCIIEVEPARNRLLLSQREAADCDPPQTEWPAWLVADGICEGTVTSVRPFGAFVDIGPLEGMIHISEISWGRVRHPRDFLEPGQGVRVKILNVDADNQRVGLSLKQLETNPWVSVSKHLDVGDVVQGSVVSVERFGVFIELVNGLEGLLHVSELDDSSARYLYQQYGIGQKVPVRVLDILPEEHRIALGPVPEGQGRG